MQVSFIVKALILNFFRIWAKNVTNRCLRSDDARDKDFEQYVFSCLAARGSLANTFLQTELNSTAKCSGTVNFASGRTSEYPRIWEKSWEFLIFYVQRKNVVFWKKLRFSDQWHHFSQKMSVYQRNCNKPTFSQFLSAKIKKKLSLLKKTKKVFPSFFQKLFFFYIWASVLIVIAVSTKSKTRFKNNFAPATCRSVIFRMRECPGQQLFLIFIDGETHFPPKYQSSFLSTTEPWTLNGQFSTWRTLFDWKILALFDASESWLSENAKKGH